MTEKKLNFYPFIIVSKNHLKAHYSFNIPSKVLQVRLESYISSTKHVIQSYIITSLKSLLKHQLSNSMNAIKSDCARTFTYSKVKIMQSPYFAFLK